MEHVGRVALLHHPSAIEHDRDVAEHPGLGEVVRDLQNCKSSLEVRRAQLAARGAARPRVERAERLVEQQHLGPAPRSRGRSRRVDVRRRSATPPADRTSASTPNRSARIRRRRRRWPRRTRRSREPSNEETDMRVDRRCRAGGAPAPVVVTSSPRRMICPDVARVTPAIVSSSVVFPAPAGPITTP